MTTTDDTDPAVRIAALEAENEILRRSIGPLVAEDRKSAFISPGMYMCWHCAAEMWEPNDPTAHDEHCPWAAAARLLADPAAAGARHAERVRVLIVAAKYATTHLVIGPESPAGITTVDVRAAGLAGALLGLKHALAALETTP
jgi:hypothetical protein